MDQETIKVLIQAFIALLASFLLSKTFSKLIIKRAHKKSYAQAIRDDIVQTHQLKKGTPTMGGIAIVGATLLTYVIVNPKFYQSITILALLLILVSFFVIGFIDDWRKVKKKDAKGLSASIRFFSEIAIVMIVLVLLNYEQSSMWGIHLPYPHDFIYIGAICIPLCILMVVGGSNGVNMADGLDGLASGLMVLALSPFIIIALNKQEFGTALLLLCLVGSLMGFLVHNFHPAKIFMGDCGSLPLGAILALSAITLNVEFLLIIAGGLFVAETASVILQVASFKTTGKRIFKMAPLHHHYEMKGVAEWKVVMLFYMCGFILSFLATVLGIMP